VVARYESLIEDLARRSSPRSSTDDRSIEPTASASLSDSSIGALEPTDHRDIP
jgi:hypothetical protein